MAFSVSYVYKIVDKYSRPLRKITRSTSRFKRLITATTRAVARFSRVLATKLVAGLLKAGRAFRRIGAQVLKLTALFGGLVGLGAGAGLVAGLRSWTDFADRLAKTSRLVGLTGQQIAQLEYIAGLTGGTVESVTSGLVKMSQTFGKMKSGTGDLFSYLKKANPALLKQAQAAETTAERFDLLISAIQQTADPAERLALATAAFGREAGVNMVKMAEMSAEQFKEAKQEFLKFYGTVEQDSLEAAEAFNDNVGRMQTAIKGFAHMLSSKLVPVLDPIVTKMAEWIAANRDLIDQKLDDLFSSWGEALERGDFDNFLSRITKSLTEFDASAFGEKLMNAAIAFKDGAVLLAQSIDKIIYAVGALMGIKLAGWAAGTAKSLAGVSVAAAGVGAAVTKGVTDTVKKATSGAGSKKLASKLLPMAGLAAGTTVAGAVVGGGLALSDAYLKQPEVKERQEEQHAKFKKFFDAGAEIRKQRRMTEEYQRYAESRVGAAQMQEVYDKLKAFTDRAAPQMQDRMFPGEAQKIEVEVDPVEVKQQMQGTITIKVPQGVTANGQMKVNDMNVGTNIVTTPN